MMDQEGKTFDPTEGVDIHKTRISLSTWCVECRPGLGSAAQFIYHGDSLCRAHFEAKVGKA